MTPDSRDFLSKTSLLLLGLVALIGLLSFNTYAATPDFNAGFKNLPSLVHLYRYQGKPKSIFGIFIALPRLYVFDNKGHEILEQSGAHDNLKKTLDKTFSERTPIKDSKPLGKWMNKLALMPDTQAYKPGDAQFTILEYWASWCEYCFQERDQLLAYFRQHPTMAVNWITVDAD